MAFNLDNLAQVLRGRGLKVVEVAGWDTRGYASQDLQGVRGVMWHHTATNRTAFFKSNSPTLNLCTVGRGSPGSPDYLPGPLANIVFGRDGTCYIVATGVANHAGTGSAPGIPTNMGNHWTIGIEMESSGIAPWDWTPEQFAEAPKLGAVLELAYMQTLPPADRPQIAHFEYSDAGKIDPAGWPGGMAGLRQSINAQIAAWSGGTIPQADTITPIVPKEDTLSAAEVSTIMEGFASMESGIRQNIRDHFLEGSTTGSGDNTTWRPGVTKIVIKNQRRINNANAKLGALENVVAQLAKCQGVAIDYAKIDASIKAALTDGIEITVGGAK